jgi:hypothetical protein
MKLYDLVIMMPGNSYITAVEPSQIRAMDEAIENAVKKGDAILKFQDGNRHAQIRVGAISGWYFKPHEKSVQEKVLDTIQRAVDPPEDNWKHATD